MSLNADAVGVKAKELAKMINDTGAASAKIVIRNRLNEPSGMIMVVHGENEAKEIVEAVEKIESSWSDEKSA